MNVGPSRRRPSQRSSLTCCLRSRRPERLAASILAAISAMNVQISSVRLVSSAPGRLESRPLPDRPRSSARDLSAMPEATSAMRSTASTSAASRALFTCSTAAFRFRCASASAATRATLSCSSAAFRLRWASASAAAR